MSLVGAQKAHQLAKPAVAPPAGPGQSKSVEPVCLQQDRAVQMGELVSAATLGEREIDALVNFGSANKAHTGLGRDLSNIPTFIGLIYLPDGADPDEQVAFCVLFLKGRVKE